MDARIKEMYEGSINGTKELTQEECKEVLYNLMVDKGVSPLTASVMSGWHPESGINPEHVMTEEEQFFQILDQLLGNGVSEDTFKQHADYDF